MEERGREREREREREAGGEEAGRRGLVRWRVAEAAIGLKQGRMRGEEEE